jgi:hypothetical protein
VYACVDYAAAHARISHALRIPAAISDFLHAEGYWDEAVALGQAAVAAAQMGNDQQGQARALSSLGFAQKPDRRQPGRHH